MENPNKTKKGNRYLSWVLRIFLILVALFFMMFSFDVFGEGRSFGEVLVAFLMHNIFTFGLIGILIIAWKREHFGGILLIAVGIFMIFFFGPFDMMYGTWIMISLPVIVGILFLCNYYLAKSHGQFKI